MSNRIYELVEEMKSREGITYRDIAERFGIPEQTLHSSRKRADMGRIGIDVFLKIAHGLGMTAEELYYGTDAEPETDVDESPSISANERVIIDAYRSDRIARRTIDHAVADYIEDMDCEALEKKEAI